MAPFPPPVSAFITSIYNYNPSKDVFLSVKTLEKRISELILTLTSIQSAKLGWDRSLTKSVSTTEYKATEAELAVINKKCIKFVKKYTKNELSSSTDQLKVSSVYFMIDQLIDLKSKLTILDFLKLAKLSRDLEKLIWQAEKFLKRWRGQEPMMLQKKAEPNQYKLDDGVLPVFNTYVLHILEYLCEEGNEVGILGSKGLGKTTVLRKLYNLLIKDKSLSGDGNKKYQLDSIIWIDYPPETETGDNDNYNLEYLQNEIMKQLEILDEASKSIVKNANTISAFLCNKHYILLMDHVSSSVDLDKVGLTKGHKHKKVVISSREREVIRRMTEHEVEIQRLDEDDARRLFESICGKLYDDHKIEIADRIIEYCAGIPGMISVVARHLKDKKDDSWWDYVGQILQSNNPKSLELLNLGGFDRMYEIKYQGLATDIKKCLLYGALLTHQFGIHADRLIDCWIAEGFIYDYEVANGQKLRLNRKLGLMILKHLINEGLLRCFGEKYEYVMVPPDFRKVALELEFPGEEKCAIWVTSKGQMPGENIWKTVTRVSMSGCKTELPQNPQCPNISTLLMPFLNQETELLPDSFFIHMKSLKVLDLNQSKLRALPGSIENLVNLKSLFLSDCLRLDALPPEAASLEKLEFLDICGTSMVSLPREIRCMVHMRCLRASFLPMESQVEEIISPGIISNLRNLEELSIFTAVDFGVAAAEGLAEELATLEHLNTLCFSFPNVSSLNTFVTQSKALNNIETSWGSRTLQSFKIFVGQRCYYEQRILGRRWFSYSTNEKFSASCQKLLNQASNFELIGHNGLQSLTSQFNLHQVECCFVGRCEDLINIMDGYVTSEKQVSSLKDLYNLHLYDLNSLQCICYGPVPPATLTNLTGMTIEVCHKLTEVLCPALARSLKNLKYLKVKNCHQISKIIEITGETSAIAHVPEESSNSDLLPSLRNIELSNLPELKSICGSWSGSISISWKSLNSIIVRRCSKLKNLCLTLTNAKNLASILCEESWWSTLPFPDELRQRLLPLCYYKKESVEGRAQLSGEASTSGSAEFINTSINHHALSDINAEYKEEKLLDVNRQASEMDVQTYSSSLEDDDLKFVGKHHEPPNTYLDLRFLDISDTKIRILPSSLFELPRLKDLLLRNCICLEELSHEIGKLTHLEVLDLSGTELYSIPDEISRLADVTSMHLSFYGPDDDSEYAHLPSRLVSPEFLSELKQLQTLSVIVHPEDHRWRETVAYITEDMIKLEKLSFLEFYFPQLEIFEAFIQMSTSWKKQILNKFNFIVGQNVKRIVSYVPKEVDSLFDQEERCLRYVNGGKTSLLLKSILIHVTSFYLDHHTEVQSLSEFDVSNFRELRFCVVRECPKMMSILDEKTAEVAFPSLEYLGIFSLWELMDIWKASTRWGNFKTSTRWRGFESLRYLIIKTCPKIRFVLGESMLRCLANLEELDVEDCEMVEKIIVEKNKKVKYKFDVLPSLRKLVLSYLPELVSLGCGDRMSEVNISVHYCPKLILKSTL